MPRLTKALLGFSVVLAVAVLAACSAHRTVPPAATPDRVLAAPRLFVFALDAVPFETVEQVVADGAFATFAPPVPLVSTFPSATSLAMSGILEPFGLTPAEGYEARYFDRDRNRVRGGGLVSYNKLKASWRTVWDWKAGNLRKLTSGVAPVKASRAAIDDALAAFVASDDPVFLAYTDATDLVGHLKSPDALRALLHRLDRGLVALRRAHPDLRFHAVLFSDHGQTGGDDLRNVRRDVRRALRRAGFRLGERIRGPRDVVLVPFGLLSSLVGYSRAPSAGDAAAALASVDGVDLCVVADGGPESGGGPEALVDDTWHLLGNDGHGRLERRRADGTVRWRYQAGADDPLGLVALVGAEAAAWHDDAWWRARTVEHAYPDPFHRIARGFELVANPASFICSLENDAMFGSLLTSTASLLSVGHLEWTHGALHRAPSLGFIASDLPGWDPPRPVRFDEALRPFAAYARDVLGVDPVID